MNSIDIDALLIELGFKLNTFDWIDTYQVSRYKHKSIESIELYIYTGHTDQGESFRLFYLRHNDDLSKLVEDNLYTELSSIVKLGMRESKLNKVLDDN